MSTVRIEVSIHGSDYEVSKSAPSTVRLTDLEESSGQVLQLIDAAVRDIKAAITARDQEEA